MKNIKLINPKNIAILILFIISFSSYSQDKLKILKATDNKNVTLIFPSAIKQATVGNSNYNFAFNTREESNLGILKAIPGEESNLLVITKEGNIYSFILNYGNNINKLTYFIKKSESIGNIDNAENINKDQTVNNLPSDKENTNINYVPNITDSDYHDDVKKYSGIADASEVDKSKLYYQDKAAYFKRICYHGVNESTYFKKYFVVSDNVFLRLENILFTFNEIYFFLEIENKAVLDYDVNFVNLYITSMNKRKRSSSQKIEHEPVFTYKIPKRVKAFSSKKFVLVYDKFSVNKNKTVIIDVNEVKGERNLKLEISHKNINNPNFK